MTKNELVQVRLAQIRRAVENENHVLTTIQAQHNKQLNCVRNADCDLNLLLIVEPGCRSDFHDSLHWLADIQHIAFQFKRGPGQFRFLFSDGLFCALTVLHDQVLFNEGKDSAITARHASQKTLSQEQLVINGTATDIESYQHEERTPPWLLNEFLTNLLVGLRRFNQGDKLSAFYCIQHHALNRLLDLIALWEKQCTCGPNQTPQEHSCDFETRYPQLMTQVSEFAQGYDRSPLSALAMLNYVEKYNSVNYFLKDQILNQIRPHSHLH